MAHAFCNSMCRLHQELFACCRRALHVHQAKRLNWSCLLITGAVGTHPETVSDLAQKLINCTDPWLHALCRHDQEHAFWVSQRMMIAGKLAAVVEKPDTNNGRSTRHSWQGSTSGTQPLSVDSLIRRRALDTLETQACQKHAWGNSANSSSSNRQSRPKRQKHQQPPAVVQDRSTAAGAGLSSGPLPALYSTRHRQPAHQQVACSSSHSAEASSSSGERHSSQKSFSEGSSSGQLRRPQYTSPATIHAQNRLRSNDRNCLHIAEPQLPGVESTHSPYDWHPNSQAEQADSVADCKQQLPMPLSELLCLWAVRLVLPHPVTQQVLKLGIPDPPMFGQVRAAEQRLANVPHPKLQLDFRIDGNTSGSDVYSTG